MSKPNTFTIETPPGVKAMWHKDVPEGTHFWSTANSVGDSDARITRYRSTSGKDKIVFVQDDTPQDGWYTESFGGLSYWKDGERIARIHLLNPDRPIVGQGLTGFNATEAFAALHTLMGDLPVVNAQGKVIKR